MRRELYSIPENLDVDKIKSSREACFADRTAVHIKNGLTEVQLQNLAQNSANGSRQQRGIMQMITPGQHRMSKEARKEIFKQLMTVQGSQARRLKAKED